MSSPPLINYELLYSPDIKKDNFSKNKPNYQSPSTTSLLNPFKEKNLLIGKTPQQNAKSIFSVDGTSTKYYSPPAYNNYVISSLQNPNSLKINQNTNIEKTKFNEENNNNSNKNPHNNNEKNQNAECFKVFARIRPLNDKEINMVNTNKKPSFLKTLIKLDDTSVKLQQFEYQINIGRDEKIFNFDHVFDEKDCNEVIFKKTVLSSVENLLNGYNSTILAYGMTGTGKTHTMFGDIYCPQSDGKILEPGLIILAVKDLFWKIEIQINENKHLEFKIKLSYLEIYNEQVKDLLVDNSDNLMILEDQTKGVVITDLTEIQLNNPSEIIKLIDQGNSRRTMASTSSNQFSSRSHAILILSIEKRNLLVDPQQIVYAKFCLVDLAGSERALLSDVKGIRMTEGANINKSLLALGNCINILSDNNKKGAFVPYRDSKLTRLLKESLGGNTKTIMIACLSPSSLSYDETLNTLKYASRAKNIKRKVNKNLREIEDVAEYKNIIEGLKNEIFLLKEQLFQKNKNEINDPSEDDNIRNSKKIERKESETSELELKVHNISHQILTNLEENWEIKQSVIELKNLKISNEISLKEKKKKLDILKNQNPIFINFYPQNQIYQGNLMTPASKKSYEIEILEKDIKSLEETMKNNDKILLQMETHLSKTVEMRNRLHDDMLKINEKNNDKLVNDLKMACEILNKEKNELKTQNIEMKKNEERLAKLQEEKDFTIQEMQKQIDFMKNKLNEKDKIIEENNLIIKNLSHMKSGVIKHKNYRSNTSDNPKIHSKLNSKSNKPDEKIEDFPKNIPGIRQYFKGKSAGALNKNSKTFRKSKDFPNIKNGASDNEGCLSSNRSNLDSKGLKKNLDKLSECSSLTRFEAGNNNESNPNKNSILFTAEDSPPHLSNKIRKPLGENPEDIECTKKIVENLSEVSSIFQEDSQNFSVSDQIVFEALDKNNNNNADQTSDLYPINEQFNENSNSAFQKKPYETEENKDLLSVYNTQNIQNLSEKNKFPSMNSKNMNFNKYQTKSVNSMTQSNFYSSIETKIFAFKEKIQKNFNNLCLDPMKIDENELCKEIFELILDKNKNDYHLDSYYEKLFNDLKNFYYKNLPNNSNLNRSNLEKNRSNSSNSAKEKKEQNLNKISNVKIPVDQANINLNGNFLRTHTEKGFYDNYDKNKKSQLFHYVKYGSINLQENPHSNLGARAEGIGSSTVKNNSIHNNNEEYSKNNIPWDELTNKRKENTGVKQIIDKQKEHFKEDLMKFEERKNQYSNVAKEINQFFIKNNAEKKSNTPLHTEKSPETEKNNQFSIGYSSPYNKSKGEYISSFENFSKFSKKR